MPEIFTWTPQKAYSVERTPNVAVVKLGDGYEQRQMKGINQLMDKYSLTFRGVSGACRSNPAKDAGGFFRGGGGGGGFFWAPSGGGVWALFFFPSWNMTKTGPLYELTATFEQVPR